MWDSNESITFIHAVAHRAFDLLTRIFPDNIKLAKVIPLFKSGDNKTFSNYRPISVLPCFSKIFEKVVYNRSMKFISKRKILNKNQYGFWENHSTALAITDFIEKISTSIDQGYYSIGIFLDLSKAFDTVNQGSILGPLLFLLYINDIWNCINQFSFILFADDTNIFYKSKSLKDLTQTVNYEVSKLSLWFKTNKLSHNIKKINLSSCYFRTERKSSQMQLKYTLTMRTSRKLMILNIWV